MRFYCKICDKTFKKFVLFEGHFEFNEKCREKHNSFIQCYLCSQQFRHLAALKYHVHQHPIQRIREKGRSTPVPMVPKITIKKQWNFKIVSKLNEDEEIDEIEKSDEENFEKDAKNDRIIDEVSAESPLKFECNICQKKYQSLHYFEQHLIMHQKKRIAQIRQEIDKSKSVIDASTAQHEPIVFVKPSSSASDNQNNIPLLNSCTCSVCKIRLRSRERLGEIDFNN